MRTIHGPNYDSHLILTADAQGHGQLEIRIRAQLRPFDPTLAEGQTTLAMTPSGDQFGGGTPARLRAWTVDAFREFERDFFRTVQEYWNDRLWLVHRDRTDYGNPRAAQYCGMDRVPRVLRCTLRLLHDAESPQMVLLAGRIAGMVPDRMRVYMCTAGGLGGTSTGHSCGRRYYFFNQPGAQGYEGRTDDFDGLITDKDVRLSASAAGARTWLQIPAVHEVGHYLGLSHVNAGPGVVPGSPAEYGASPHQCSDVMGRGMRFDAWHAWPWLNRLRRHVNLPWTHPPANRPTVGRWSATARDPWLEATGSP